MGQDKFNLDGGGRGDMSLPHKLHQDTLGNCNTCHDLFPKELGGIEKMKAEGKLKRKQVIMIHIGQNQASEKAQW